MSRIYQIQQKINDTSAAMSHLERSIATHPGERGLRLTMRSLLSAYENLTYDFMEEANRLEIDVCRYRLFTNGGRHTVSAVSAVLSDFQRLVSTVYDAIRNGPKVTARVAPESRVATEFEFSHTFSGSLGVVFTLPNERLLFGDSHIDEAIKTVFKIAKAESPEDVRALSARLGKGPIRIAHQWAADHVGAGMGADISWLRMSETRASVLVQEPELERLQGAIETIGEVIDEEIDVEGELVAINLVRKTFLMEVPGGEIRGKFADAVSADHRAILPRQYRAKLRKTTRVRFAQENDEVTYFLIALDPIDEVLPLI